MITDPNSHGISGVVYLYGRCLEGIKRKCRHIVIDDIEVCRRLAPTWPKGCYRLGTARMACGLFEDAAVAAFEGIKLDNNNEDLKALTKEAVRRGKVEHQKRQQQQQQQQQQQEKDR